MTYTAYRILTLKMKMKHKIMSNSIFSHFKSNARGVAMLFNTNKDYKIYQEIIDNNACVRNSPNGTIGNFTNGTIGSQWYHW